MPVFVELPDPSAAAHAGEPSAGGEVEPQLDRRRSGPRRRMRDRLLDRGSRPTEVPPGALARVRDIENLLLFIDDDLRETALALVRIEDFLGGALETLGDPDVRREHILSLASNANVLDHIDQLSETLESLRRRLAKLSSSMK
jgi:hypothetical protein